MPCPQYLNSIHEAVDGTIGSIRRAELELHVDSCDACRALLEDLQRIRDAAAALPTLDPPDGAWLQIAGRLRQQGRVAATPAAGARRSYGIWLAAAAAVILVVASAVMVLPRFTSTPAPPTAGNAPDGRTVESVQSAVDAAQQKFEEAIAELEKVAKANQQALDPETSATITKNLGILDQAIADNRAAVNAEPASVAARETLFQALKSKVALLQSTITLINEMRKGNNAAAAQLVNKSSSRTWKFGNLEIWKSGNLMRPLVRHRALLTMLLLTVPAGAGAQVYPERIIAREKIRAVVAYQRRDANNRVEEVERTTRTLKLGANGVLGLGNIAGDIIVTRGGGPDATVEIVKTARGRDQSEAREMLQLVQVEVTERGGRADVRTRYPDSGRNNRRNISVSVAYNVTAPAGARLSIESISGSVKVTDIKGDVSANTVSGDVRISGAARINAAKTISGMVEIVDAQTDGALESGSVSGDVILRRVKANRIEASTVSGSIKLEEVQSERVDASSTSGSVSFAGPLARGGRYELNSFSGEIRVAVSGNTGFEVDANSFSGEIRPELQISMRNPDPGGRRRRTTLNGTYGDGSAVLDLTTFSGSIVISRR